MDFKGMIFVGLTLFAVIEITDAGDPDIISDFLATPNATLVDANFFTHTGLRDLVGADPPTSFEVSKASLAEFPSLNGQSVSIAVLRYAPGTMNPLHSHPRASELLFVTEGSLQVGFVDTQNKLYIQSLQEGDMFVFPKGLVHYQYNGDAKNPASAVSAFGSASAGTVSFPNSVFTTGIDSNILAASFKTDVSTIEKIKTGLSTKA